MKKMKSLLLAAACAALSTGIAADLESRVLKLPFGTTTVEVEKGSRIAEFAAKELNLVVAKAAGGTYAVVTNGVSSSVSGRPSPRIVIRRDDAYADEESAVYEKDGNLHLVGGGQLGCLYAVYDFLEDSLGFRHYFNRVDGWVVDTVDVVAFNGKATRKRPAFRGYRKDHHDNAKEALFEVRNRCNARNCERVVPGYRNPISPRIPGHGFNPFLLPPYDNDGRWGHIFDGLGIKGAFKEHPEWFSLGADGRRHDDMQLCLSNPGCREKLLENLVSWMKRYGAGIYMVGSNDNHNDRYCWCRDCIALEKKYASVGGPLWDWILWACPELKRRGLNDTYIASLAYKGWRQTELAPKGVEKFPDNFVCAAAFLNADRELAWAFFDTKLPDGTTYNRLENLKRWCGICSHVSYWYYGGANPAQVYDRAQKEIRELYSCGVKSVGFCGTGGAAEFGDFTGYLCFRLLRDPYADLEPDLKRIFAIKYGPAAALVRRYADLLNTYRVNAIQKIPATTGTDAWYAGFNYLEGKDLFALRTIMDEALVVAKGTPFEQCVKEARFGLNVWTISGMHKLRQADPVAAAKIDCAALDAESRAAEEAYDRRRGAKPNGFRPVARELDQMANYATLKSDELPEELKGYPKDRVFRILPAKHAPYYCGSSIVGNTCERDERAACGWAWTWPVPDKADYVKTGKIPLCAYDSGNRVYPIPAGKGAVPIPAIGKDVYRLYRLGYTTIPPKFWMVVCDQWAHCGINGPARLFDPSYVNKNWEIWISCRGEGPKIFADADSDAPSAFWIDQVFCIDMGVPEGK